MTPTTISNPAPAPFNYYAALYFLPAGHYLFKTNQSADRPVDERAEVTVKFVTADDVAAAFSGQDHDTGWIPAGLVRTGYCWAGPWFVYSAPAQKVDIVLGGDRLTIPIPRTVLCGMGKDYYLWALKSKTFNPQAKAFHAPFPNVYTNNTYPPGRICWGQNVPGEADPMKARKLWEFFFAAPFNSDLAGGKSSSHSNDICALLADLPNSCPNKYPESDLVDTRKTISALVDDLLEKRSW